MLNFIQGWSYNILPNRQTQLFSSKNQTILAVALGALALGSANIFDRTNPALATVLRCSAAGIGFVWLFNRYVLKRSGVSHQAGLAGQAYQQQAVARNYWSSRIRNYLPSFWSYRNPAPVSLFPAVHVVHAQPHQASMYQAPVSRPSVQPVPQVAFVPQAKSSSVGFPTVHVAPAQPHPASMYQAPVARPSVQPVPQAAFVPQKSSSVGFPTVHVAPAQPHSAPMYQAPVFSNVQPASMGGSITSLGNQPMFPAVARR